MSATPFIDLIKDGTFITLPSASEDYTNVFSSGRKFLFSHFALLKIPKIESSYVNVSAQNMCKMHAVEGYESLDNSQYVGNQKNIQDLSEMFQNYVLNFETLLTSRPEYKRNNLHTVSERVFFKFLKEIGAMRFQNSQQDGMFVEEISPDYDSIVKYVGECELQGNNTVSNENVFSELYVYIPSQNGGTPCVQFQSIEDDNYNPKTIIYDTNPDEVIHGRTSQDNPTQAGLSIEAVYDIDSPIGSIPYRVESPDGRTNMWWEDKATAPNCYLTDPEFGDCLNDTFYRNPDQAHNAPYIRNRLDGISINFDVESYQDVVSHNEQEPDNQVHTFAQYNSLSQAHSFDFNCVLLYYTIYDEVTKESCVNLYGVVFMNNILSVSASASQISLLKKIKQSNYDGTQGNAYGFKFNFKFDTSSSQAQRHVEVSVNDYNTMSMSMFADAVSKLNHVNRQYERIIFQNSKLVDRIRQRAFGVDDNLILQIQNFLQSANFAVSQHHQEVLQLYQSLNQKLNDILENKTEIDVRYAWNIISKNGVNHYPFGDKLVIEGTQQNYSWIRQYDISVQNTHILGLFTNLIIHSKSGIQYNFKKNQTFYVDDSSVGWKDGQTVEFFFKDPVSYGSYLLNISTGNINGQYSVNIGSVQSLHFSVVCVDAKTNNFIIIKH